MQKECTANRHVAVPTVLPVSCVCVCVFAGVPAATSAKLKANEWVNSALTVLGGKGGGKPTIAQGQGNEFGKAAEAMAAAEQFAGLKL